MTGIDQEDREFDIVRGMWSRELHRCRTDYEYLARTYLKIQSKKRIASQMLTMNIVQKKLWEKMVDQKRRTGKIRQIWGKPRKIGATTLVRGLSFWLTTFHKYRKSLLVTHDEPSSYEVFGQNDLSYYRGLPRELKPLANYESKSKLSFYALKSEVTVGHSRDVNVGVTQMYDILHLTELARFRNADTVMNDALFPTLSEAEAKADSDWGCSVCVIESTSRYGGVYFKDFFEAARRGENEFEATFIPAYLHLDYQMEVPDRFTLTVAERSLMSQHSLPITHMVWRRAEQAKYAKNPALFRQNYPLTWEESWVLPSGTERVLSDDLLEVLERGLRPGKRMMVDGAGLHDMVGGPLEVWEKPVDGVFYDMGVDIASGKGYEGDKTVVEVVRRGTLEQVAEMVTVMDPASKEFEEIMYWTGMVYNSAQIVPDVTGGWGWALLSALQRRSYPSIWQPRKRYDAKERISTNIGFRYSRDTKRELVNNMVLLVRQRSPQVHSTYLYNEMVSFLEVGRGEWDAAPGMNDDAINAYMLALMGSFDDDNVPSYSELESEKESVWIPEYKSFDFDEELTKTRQKNTFGHAGWEWL